MEIIKAEEKNGQIFATTKLIMSDATRPSIPFYLVKFLKQTKRLILFIRLKSKNGLFNLK
jgi:hypothetical protein